MSPILSSIAAAPISPPRPVSLARPLSSSSIQSFATSLRLVDVVADSIRVEGLRHARVTLKARKYKLPDFVSDVSEVFRLLDIRHSTRDLVIQKVSGALTNAVFFVSFPSGYKNRTTVVLRVYGPSSGSLISRPRELHILHILSSKYQIGPRILGTFENGRVEEYFESTTLTAQDIRDPEISRWIGARMAELHSVDIEAVEGEGWKIGVEKSVRSWLMPARQVLRSSSLPQDVRRELDIDAFERDWDKYLLWLVKVDDILAGSRRVFAHNDTQYGNLLKLKRPNAKDHRQIIVVDFEYSAPNPASYDIANHFHEWTANYHSKTPHLLDISRYPSLEERYNFYLSYLHHTCLKEFQHPIVDLESTMVKLDRQVQIWSPASHALWLVWGIVQARDDLENYIETPEFDYIAYARCRLACFRRELRELGVL